MVVSRIPPSPTGVTLVFSVDRFRRALDGEIGAQIDGVALDRSRAGDDHADVRELLGLEEVGGAHVLVALADAGAHRCGLDVEVPGNRLGGGDLAVAAELGEAPLTGASPHNDLAFTAMVD